MLSPQQQQKAIDTLLQKKENSLCADCNGKTPCWASLDFGVFVCMNCSGAHRALGPSITRVRSTKLDTWNRDWLQNMKVGNTILNEYWQNQLSGVSRSSKPNVNTSLNEIIKFVKDKYLKKKYVDPNEPLDPLQRYKQSQQGQIQPQKKPIPKQQPKQQPKINNESPFNGFENLGTNKQKPQRKSSDNLISFEKQSGKPDLIIGQVPSNHQGNKYNHANFHTVSGSKAKEDENLISFDSLLKSHQPVQHQHQHQHLNYQINHHPNQFHNNAGHYSTGHFGTHAQFNPQNDRHQYIGMNQNIYSKGLNMNIHPNTVNNYNNPASLQEQTFANQFLSTPAQKQPQNQLKITLDSNINLDVNGKSKKQEPKSWIDQWK